jgi:hypothetical protein
MKVSLFPTKNSNGQMGSHGRTRPGKKTARKDGDEKAVKAEGWEVETVGRHRAGKLVPVREGIPNSGQLPVRSGQANIVKNVRKPS